METIKIRKNRAVSLCDIEIDGLATKKPAGREPCGLSGTTGWL
jgi:hypothetical protein